jgi:tRNA pseudouridine(38-40) synthase
VIWVVVIISFDALVHMHVFAYRYAAQVAYDGSAFSGWQSLPTERTVQGVLIEVLSEYLGHPTKVQGSSRTDAGVHARGQVIHFDTPTDDVDLTAVEMLNSMLPKDVQLVWCCKAPNGLLPVQTSGDLQWHAMVNAVSKVYSYRFSVHEDFDIFDRFFVANLYDHKATNPFDPALLEDVCQLLVGTHDFRAFGNRLDQRAKAHEEISGGILSTERTIFSVNVTAEKRSDLLCPLRKLHDKRHLRYPRAFTASSHVMDISSGDSPVGQDSTYSNHGEPAEIAYYKVDVHLDGALYKMVRNVLAGCVAVGYGALTLDAFAALLHDAPERKANRLVPLPACGLCLERVTYRETF